MRTLKKALSLVLVLAMVFTLAVPALAVDKASEFKDYAKVQNKEAVDVLTALGVINGNADGTFGAEGKFTRAQGATMIAYLTLGKTVADALPTGGTQFTDVPANFWGAKYIQYCANEGIINGYGNGKFGPDDELTAAQWALMLLGALGYEAKNEGIGGAGWEIQVTKLAMNAKVATAEDMTGAMTRDTAAKMAFNTLKANVVAYESNGTDITIGDTNINVGATKAEPVKNSKADDYRANAADQDEIQQFCELHFPKLELTKKGNDDFGRPATEWKNGTTTTIGTYAKEATLSYTTKVTGGKLYTDLGKVTPDTLTITRNGVGASSTTDALATIKSGNTETFDLTGNGVLTEVYYDADTKTATVVEITTKLGKITAYTPAKTNKDGEVTQKATITVDGKTFETNAYSKADVNKTYVLYTYIGDKSYKTVGTIKSVATATSETMVPTRVNGTTSFVAGGETYSYTLGTDAVSANTVTNKDEVVVYFDSYGYVIGTDKPATAVGQYAFVIKAVNDSSDIWNTGKRVAKVVLNTGKESVIVELDTNSVANGDLENNIVTYEVSNGKYLLKLVDPAAELTDNTDKDALTITKGVANGKVGGKDVIFSSKTVFLVISGTENEPVYTVYTGINNVPSLVGTAKAEATVKTDNHNIAEFVVVKNAAGGATSTTDTYFVLGSDVGETTDVTIGKYYEYKAVVNGELTTVKTADPIAKGSYKFVSSVSVNEKGVITAFGTAVEAENATGTEAYDADLGLVKLGAKSYTVSSDCAVYTVENGEITVGSIDNILTDANDTVVYTLKDGVVTSVYVTVVG